MHRIAEKQLPPSQPIIVVPEQNGQRPLLHIKKKSTNCPPSGAPKFPYID